MSSPRFAPWLIPLATRSIGPGRRPRKTSPTASDGEPSIDHAGVPSASVRSRSRSAWGSETPIRARITPVGSADVVSPLPCRPGPRASARQCWTAWPRRNQGPRDPRPPPSAPGVAADGWPTAAPDHRPGPPRGGESGDPERSMGRLPRDPGNAPPLASRARTQEVDLPPNGSPGPAADRSRAPRTHPPPRPRELALGLRADPGRASQARPRSERDDDPHPAPSGPGGAGPATERPDLDRVPAGPGGGHHRLRLLHRRDRLAPDALRPGVHRAWQPADPCEPRDGAP